MDYCKEVRETRTNMRFILRIMVMVFGFNLGYAIEPVPIVEAVAGGVASLPCDVSIPSRQDLISLILWYRDSNRAPIYTLDFRRGSPDKPKHFPSGTFAGRANFNIADRPPILKLKNVTQDDRGLYKCRIEYKRSRTITRNIKLKIIEPPRAVVILDDRGQKLKDIAGPYDEGAYLSLICEAEGGDPLPTLTWWRNNALLDDTFFKTSQGNIRNELTILELRRSDLLAELLCQAWNTNLVYPSNSSLRIDLNLKPLYVRITTPQHPLKVGEDVRLDCESSGSRPPAKITWWMHSRKIQSERDSHVEGRGLTYSSLVVRPTKEDQGKSVICQAENPLLPHKLEDVWYLDVLYPPEVSLHLGANIKYSTIKEGNDVYLECLIRANPPPTELSWYFEGEPYFGDPQEGIIISNQSLVLQKVKKEHRGRYKCTASNSEGHGQSLDLLLEVRYAPICKPAQKTVYGVARGEVINISCEVDADPIDVTFRWALDNSLEQTQLKNYTWNGSYSVVTFAPNTALAYGSVVCWARNSVGEQTEPCVTKIIPAGPPDPVRDCFVLNRTHSLISVICEPGYDGGLKQRFHLDVYNSAVDHLHVNLTSTEAPAFDVGNLPSGTQFVLVIYATNEKGKSNSVALVGATLFQPSDSKGSKKGSFSPVIIILLSLLCTFLLIGGAILFYLRVKRRRIPLKVVYEKNKEDVKFKEIKKVAEDIIENTVACPDVVPPNSGHSISSETVSTANSHNVDEISKSNICSKCKVEQIHPSCMKGVVLQQKAEVEVILPNANTADPPITRILKSPSSHQTNIWTASSSDCREEDKGKTKSVVIL